MSLRRVSSCDFETNLPVCKNADFPIYKDFLLSEIPKLKEMVKQDWYKKAKKESRYLRAYLVEEKLGTFSEKELFWLLQEGHFNDPKNTYGNKKYFEAFRKSVNDYLKVADKDEWSFVYMTGAFARVHSDEPEKARHLIETANKYIPKKMEFLRKYGDLVEACIGYEDAGKCQASYPADVK